MNSTHDAVRQTAADDSSSTPEEVVDPHLEEPVVPARELDLSLAGKHVVLTRALGNLGRIQAARLSAAGARVTLLDLPTLGSDAFQLLRELGESRFIGLDLGVTTEARRVAKLFEPDDAIDVLVNNASESLKVPFGQLSADDLEGQMDSGCMSTFLVTRALCEGMKTRGRGSIINVCSPTYNGEWNGYVSQAPSNAAVVGLTRSLARELGVFGVRVNSISPGAVASRADFRVFGDRLAEYDDWVIQNQCLKRRLKAFDIANLVAFLASDMSAMITSQNISIDGGW